MTWNHHQTYKHSNEHMILCTSFRQHTIRTHHLPHSTKSLPPAGVPCHTTTWTTPSSKMEQNSKTKYLLRAAPQSASESSGAERSPAPNPKTLSSLNCKVFQTFVKQKYILPRSKLQMMVGHFGEGLLFGECDFHTLAGGPGNLDLGEDFGRSFFGNKGRWR